MRKSRTFCVQPSKEGQICQAERIMWEILESFSHALHIYQIWARDWQVAEAFSPRWAAGWHEANPCWCQLYIHFKIKRLSSSAFQCSGNPVWKHSLDFNSNIIAVELGGSGRPLTLSSKISWHKSCYLPINTIENRIIPLSHGQTKYREK